MKNHMPSEGDDLNAALNNLDDNQPNQLTASSPVRLTQSQRAVTGQLNDLLKLRLLNTRILNFCPRTHGLIVGPSGAGKTAVIRYFCQALHLPLFSVSVGNWIVQGAHNSNYTLTLLSRFIESNPAGVILIDELDKMSGEFARQSSWSASVQEEFFALLDGDSRLLTCGFSFDDLERLGSRFLVLGAGAWQRHWREATGDKASSYLESILEKSEISDELLFRFHERVLVVTPPNQEELEDMVRELHVHMGLEVGDAPKVIAAQAVARRQSLRYLEAYAGDLVLKTTAKVSTQKLLHQAVGPVKAKNSRMFLGETPAEASKRIQTALRENLGGLEGICADLARSLEQATDEDVSVLYQAWAIDTESPLDVALYGLTENQTQSIPSTTFLQHRMEHIEENRDQLIFELKGCLQVVGACAKEMARPGISMADFKVCEKQLMEYGIFLREGLTGLRKSGDARHFSSLVKSSLSKWAQQLDRCHELYRQATALI